MDLKKLRHLAGVAAELNFARAAEKLHITQPALSRSILSLEQEIGIKLFDRDTSRVRLTVAGKSVVACAQDLLKHAGNIEWDIALLRDGAIGNLAFGIGPMSRTYLISAITEVLRAYPGLHIAVEINNASYLLDHLLAETIEFFVAGTDTLRGLPDIQISPLPQLEIFFYVRRGHPLERKRNPKMADLLPYGFLSAKIYPSKEENIRRLMGLKRHQELPFALICDDLSFLKEVALTTDCILLASKDSVREECRVGNLSPVRLKNSPVGYTEIGIVSLQGRTFSPSANLIIGKLQAN